MRRYILLVFLFIVGCFSTSYAQDRIAGPLHASRSEVLAQNGMVATSHPLASQVGLDILKKGGSAVDAAIAANAVLGLMEPTGCGIGGDLFAIVWSAKEQKLFGLNASGRSPKALDLSYFQDKKISKIPAYGPLPVTVPGCVHGWQELHDKFGVLKLAEVLNPAIGYARAGFPVTELIGYYLENSAKRFKEYPNFVDTYMPEGKPLRKGAIFSNPYLADTYQAIAQDGAKAFYDGALTGRMVDFLQSQGGLHTYEDFSEHHSEWVDPVSVDYRGYEVWELPPNGQGIAALQILNIMEEYDVRGMGFGSPDYVHTFVEAKKIAFEDRAKFYADPSFHNLPIEMLLSKEYAQRRKTEIDPSRAASTYETAELEQGNTIYLTVADKEGNLVSLIQSNYRGMGSGMVPPGMGFMFQDRGELFSLEEGHANCIAPRKRPFHTIIPAFITKDGKPWMSFGLMGGAMQPQGHAQIVMNMIDFGMNVQEAGDAPRIRHGGSSQPTGERMTDGGEVYLESQIPYATIRELMRRGHRVGYSLGNFGGYQAIRWDDQNRVYVGASESRKDGQVVGF